MKTHLDLDRAADLHYAFQFGQEFARTNDEAIKEEFNRKFGSDEEAIKKFNAGVEQIEKRFK